MRVGELLKVLRVQESLTGNGLLIILIGKQLTGTRLGILGMGRIGQKIAHIAKSLGMIIHYHNQIKA